MPKFAIGSLQVTEGLRNGFVGLADGQTQRRARGARSIGI
jgi:hypothetical protein